MRKCWSAECSHSTYNHTGWYSHNYPISSRTTEAIRVYIIPPGKHLPMEQRSFLTWFYLHFTPEKTLKNKEKQLARFIYLLIYEMNNSPIASLGLFNSVSLLRFIC